MNKNMKKLLKRFKVGEGKVYHKKKKIITQFKGELITNRRK
jgi:hypothetical protein